jgi:hypothetical protein
MAIHEAELEADRQFPGGNPWRLRNLNHVTVVFGRNGAGKSLILRNLRDRDRERRHYASPERAGEFAFNPSYMQEEYLATSRGNRRTGNTAPTYRDEVVARIQAFLAKRGNTRGTEMPESPEQIEDLMNTLMPAFSFSILGGAQPVQLKRISDEEVVANANSLSSGEAALYALGLDLVGICAMWVLDGVAGTLLVDEPDLHLHQDLQQHLARFLVQLIDSFDVQIVVATHSTTLLAALGHHGAERTSVVYLDPTIDEQRAAAFTDVEQQLATILGGHALMGPLFAVPLLLVEGDDDYKIWSQAARYQRLKVSVIPCEGSRLAEYRRKLETVFAATIETAQVVAHSIQDLDDRIEQPAVHGSFVSSLWLNCREAENLYLTAEVLNAFETSTDGARARILENAARFGEKEARLRDVANSADWRTVDCKDVIVQISEILDDPRHVDWAKRVGSVIGENRPTGQLEEFLGRQILNALWPDTTDPNP